MGTQQTPAPSVSATKNSSAPSSIVLHVQCKFVGVVRVGLRFSACVVDGSARD